MTARLGTRARRRRFVACANAPAPRDRPRHLRATCAWRRLSASQGGQGRRSPPPRRGCNVELIRARLAPAEASGRTHRCVPSLEVRVAACGGRGTIRQAQRRERQSASLCLAVHVELVPATVTRTPGGGNRAGSRSVNHAFTTTAMTRTAATAPAILVRRRMSARVVER